MVRLVNAVRYKTSIGFVGLGQMGYPMATNLFKKSGSAEFVVFDVNQATSAKFASENPGASVASDPCQLAKKCSIVITMLPESKHVKAVYSGDKGLLQGATQPKLFIDSSTIDPATSKNIHELALKNGSIALDAPVSGEGVGGATAGTLTFMVGAPSEQDFNKAKQTLLFMGKNIVHCGLNGNGQVAKICNNMLLGISMLAASETMNLGVHLGMDPKLLASIINTSSGRCWSTDTYNPCPGVMPNVPSSRDYQGGFGVSLMAKDMGLACSAANASGSTLILGTLTRQIYKALSSTDEYAKKDFSSVYKWIKD